MKQLIEEARELGVPILITSEGNKEALQQAADQLKNAIRKTKQSLDYYEEMILVSLRNSFDGLNQILSETETILEDEAQKARITIPKNIKPSKTKICKLNNYSRKPRVAKSRR